MPRKVNYELYASKLKQRDVAFRINEDKVVRKFFNILSQKIILFCPKKH